MLRGVRDQSFNFNVGPAGAFPAVEQLLRDAERFLNRAGTLRSRRVYRAMAGSGGSRYPAAAIASTSHGVCSVDFQLEKAKSNPDYHSCGFQSKGSLSGSESVALAPLPRCSLGQIKICGCASYRHEQGTEEVHKKTGRAESDPQAYSDQHRTSGEQHVAQHRCSGTPS